MKIRTFVWPAMGSMAVLGVLWGTRVSLAAPVTRFIAVAATLLGSAILVALPGVALVAAVSSRRGFSTPTRFGLLVVGSGVAALADFWAWIASPVYGETVAAALLISSVVVIAAIQPTAVLDDPELRLPLFFGLLVALAYSGFAYSQGGLGGSRWQGAGLAGNTTLAMSYRYWLSPDNTLPFHFAQNVAEHISLRVPILGGWQSSDRPPLQTAFTLELFPLFGNRVFGYQFLATALQATWVPAVWVLLRSRGFATARVLIAVGATALTGGVFLNTVYVWPKMLAGACALAALAVLLEKGPLALAGVLATLAFLAHGGIAFSLLALLPFAVRSQPKVRQAVRTFSATAVLYLPWVAYQQFVDPPGDRLLKWEFAGVIEPDHNSFLHDLIAQYSARPLHPFVLNKVFNLRTLLGSPRIWTSFSATPVWHGVIGAARVASISSVVLASGPLMLGVVALAGPRARTAMKEVSPLAGFVLLSAVLWVLLMFGGSYESSTLLHQGSYAVLVLLVALAALAVTYLPRPLVIGVGMANVVWFAVAWVPSLGFHPAQPGIATSADWAMVALCLAAALATLGLAYRSVTADKSAPSSI